MKPAPIRYVVSSLPMQAGSVPAPGVVVAPTAEFIGSPTSGAAPVAVTFTNQSSGGYSALLWDFGDGSTSTSANPTHVYTAAGTYTVTLTLTWAGGTVTRTRTAYIVASAVTPALTFSLADTGVAGVAASGGITNTSSVASGPWSIAAIANSTMTPSSGSSIAPGATVSLSFTATQAATYTPILVCAGATITGASQPIVVSAPPAIALSATGGGSPTVGVPFNLSALLSNPASLPLVGTPENVAGSASFSPTAVTWNTGDLNKTFAATWAAAGAVSVRVTAPGGLVSNTLSLTVGTAPPPPPPPPPPSAPADWVARRTSSNAIAWRGLDTITEVQKGAGTRDPDLNAVALYREDDPIVGSALVFKFLGATLTADFLVSGGNGPRPLQASGLDEWPTTFPYRVFLSKLPDDGGTFKTLVEVSGIAGNTATVTRIPVNTSEFGSGTFTQDYLVGDSVGSECQNFNLLFSALSAADTGKAADDPAAAGTLPVRSRIPGNPLYVPQTTSVFGYGYCMDPVYRAPGEFNPWVPNYQGAGGDSVSRSNPADTSEIFVSYLQWLDPNGRLPLMTGGKLVGPQTETTVPQQVVMGVGPGGGNFSIPSTLEAPVLLSKFSFASYGSAGIALTANPYNANGSSFQPGSLDPVSGKSWEATAIYAAGGLPSTGQNTPDGSSALEHKYGRWTAWAWRLKPGRIWHYSLSLQNAYNSSTDTSITLIADPTDWPTGPFSLQVEVDNAHPVASTLAVTSRSGKVLSGVSLTSGPAVVLGAFPTEGRGVIKTPATPAGADALSSEIELWFADYGASQWTRVLRVTGYPLNFGSNGQYTNLFNGALPGFNNFVFWGYRNSELGVSHAPFRTLYQKFAQMLVTTSMPAVPRLLPDWAPAPGEVAVLSTANGLLTNRLTDVTAPYYASFYTNNVINGDSGTVFNPHWGAFGAIVCHGTGHASGNDNMVAIAELGQAAITFKRLSNPAPIFGTGTDGLTQARNAGYDEPAGYIASINDYGEYDGAFTPSGFNNDGGLVASQQPAGPHSYGALDIIGPADGGAACGTLFTVVVAAPGHKGEVTPAPAGRSGSGAHKMDFATSTGSTGSYVWGRDSNAQSPARPTGGPVWTQFIAAQKRTYIEAKNATAAAPVQWYDHVSKTYVQGSGTQALKNSDNPYTGTMFDVPERNLLILADRFGGNLRIQYAVVGVGDTNPSWQVATVSTLAVVAGFTSADWCPDNSRIIVLGGSADTDGSGNIVAAHELQIPATLTDTWTIVRAPFGAGQSIQLPMNSDPFRGSPSYKKWSYNPSARCFPYFPTARRSDQGAEVIYAYRPRGT